MDPDQASDHDQAFELDQASDHDKASMPVQAGIPTAPPTQRVSLVVAVDGFGLCQCLFSPWTPGGLLQGEPGFLDNLFYSAETNPFTYGW